MAKHSLYIVYPADEVVQTPIGAALTRRAARARDARVRRRLRRGRARRPRRRRVRSRTGSARPTPPRRARVQQDVRASFAEMTGDVEGSRAGSPPTRVRRRWPPDAGTDEARPRAVRRRGRRARKRHSDDLDLLAVTIYDASGATRAWAGRASDLPADRTKAPASLFVTPSPLGLRLVYLQPIAAASSGSRAARLGRGRARAHRRAAAGALLTTGEYSMPTARGPVSLRLHDARAPARRADGTTFVVAAPDGTPLLDASVAPVGPRRASARACAAPSWRRRSRCWRSRCCCSSGRCSTRGRSPRAPGREWRLTPDHPGGVRRRHRDAVAGLHDFAVVERGRRTARRAACCSPACWRPASRRRSSRPPSGCGWRCARGGGVPRTIRCSSSRCSWRAAWSSPGCWCSSSARWDGASIRRRSISGISRCTRGRAPRLATLAGILLGHAAVLWTVRARLRDGARAAGGCPAAGRRATLAAAALWLLPIAAVGAIGARRGGWVVPVSAVVPRRGGVRGRGARRAAAGHLVPARHRRLADSRALHGVPAAGAAGLPVGALLRRAGACAATSPRATPAKRCSIRRNCRTACRRRSHEIDALPRTGRRSWPRRCRRRRTSPHTETAFRIWSQTVLARERLTSDLEIYDRQGRAGRAASRSTFPNTPAPRRRRSACAAASGTCSARRCSSAARRSATRCTRSAASASDGTARSRRWSSTSSSTTGRCRSSARSRPTSTRSAPSSSANPLDGPPAGDVEFTVYGWGLTAIYSSGPDAWPLDDDTFQRIYHRRRASRSGRSCTRAISPIDVYFANDRQFIYALGYRDSRRLRSPRAPRRADDAGGGRLRADPARQRACSRGWRAPGRAPGDRCCARSAPASTASCSSRSCSRRSSRC